MEIDDLMSANDEETEEKGEVSTGAVGTFKKKNLTTTRKMKKALNSLFNELAEKVYKKEPTDTQSYRTMAYMIRSMIEVMTFEVEAEVQARISEIELILEQKVGVRFNVKELLAGKKEVDPLQELDDSAPGSSGEGEQ